LSRVPGGPKNWTFLKIVTPIYDDTEKCVLCSLMTHTPCTSIHYGPW